MDDQLPQHLDIHLRDRQLKYRLMAIIDQDPDLNRLLQDQVGRVMAERKRRYPTHQWAAKWQVDYLVLNFHFDLYPQRELFPNLTRLARLLR